MRFLPRHQHLSSLTTNLSKGLQASKASFRLRQQSRSMSIVTVDTSLLRPEAISAQTKAVNDKIEAVLASSPTIMEVGHAAVRESRERGEGILGHEPLHPKVYWEDVTANGLTVPVRIFEPETETVGTYYHIHGGGHTIGSAAAMDQTMYKFAEDMKLKVVSVEYRLAPENPWPAPANDCEAAALWLVENQADRFGPGPLFIGGESAGAHLSAVTLVRLKNKHGISPFSAANLVYGVYDMSGTPSVKGWGDRNLILNKETIGFFGECLLPREQFSRKAIQDPDISPMFADLTGLCPALFTIGTLDPLMDDSILMATRWGASGNQSELAIYPGGIHAFDQIKGLKLGEEAKAHCESFLKGYCYDEDESLSYGQAKL